MFAYLTVICTHYITFKYIYFKISIIACACGSVQGKRICTVLLHIK